MAVHVLLSVLVADVVGPHFLILLVGNATRARRFIFHGLGIAHVAREPHLLEDEKHRLVQELVETPIELVHALDRHTVLVPVDARQVFDLRALAATLQALEENIHTRLDRADVAGCMFPLGRTRATKYCATLQLKGLLCGSAAGGGGGGGGGGGEKKPRKKKDPTMVEAWTIVGSMGKGGVDTKHR